MIDISYTLIRRKGMKNLRLKITAAGEVVVSANPVVPIKTIEAFISSKSEWIYQNVIEMKNKPACGFILEQGGCIEVFGEEFTLCIKEGDGGYSASHRLLLITPADITNNAEIEGAFLSFIAKYSRNVLEGFFHKYYPLLKYSGIKPRIVLRLLKSRWGSWDRIKGEMMFNYALSRVPLRLAEYVVVHELVHLIIHGHGKDFYSYGEKFLPGFKELDRKLNRYSTDFTVSVKEEQFL